jgi:tetratricopeptide (TPR) repeat protein
MIKPSVFYPHRRSRVNVCLNSEHDPGPAGHHRRLPGSLLAGAEVEAKLGKGIFTPAQNRTHAASPLEKKTVARSAHTSRQTQPQPSGQQQRTRDESEHGHNFYRRNDYTPVLDADDYNQQGDELFDAGQFDKAAAAYQQAIKLRPDYPEAHLNLGETFFNLGSLR